MTHTRRGILAGLLLALASGGTACGKYGPPQRIGTEADVAAQSAAEAEAECEDEERQP